MKTEQSKQLMQKALSKLPQDFALREARRHLARAIVELNKVEDKREKRTKQTPLERWKLDLETSSLMAPSLTSQQQVNALQQLDVMIDNENKKISKIENPADDDLLID